MQEETTEYECSECGTTVTANDTDCPTCGVSLAEVISPGAGVKVADPQSLEEDEVGDIISQFECPRCGATCTPEAVTCPTCGLNFGEFVERALQSHRRHRRRVLLLLFFMVPGLYLVSLLGEFFLGEKVSKAFIGWVILAWCFLLLIYGYYNGLFKCPRCCRRFYAHKSDHSRCSYCGLERG